MRGASRVAQEGIGKMEAARERDIAATSDAAEGRQAIEHAAAELRLHNDVFMEAFPAVCLEALGLASASVPSKRRAFAFHVVAAVFHWGGMKKRYIVNLTVAERETLTQLVRRERVSGLKRMRASILLKADDDQTDQEIADDLEVGLVTVERVRKRCIERGVEACLERKAQDIPSRPRKLDGVTEAKLVQLACSPPPPGRARWTLSLLADQLVELEVFDSVSISTIQRGLKKTSSSRGL